MTNNSDMFKIEIFGFDTDHNENLDMRHYLFALFHPFREFHKEDTSIGGAVCWANTYFSRNSNVTNLKY